jgi:hypothetical protein
MRFPGDAKEKRGQVTLPRIILSSPPSSGLAADACLRQLH